MEFSSDEVPGPEEEEEVSIFSVADEVLEGREGGEWGEESVFELSVVLLPDPVLFDVPPLLVELLF